MVKKNFLLKRTNIKKNNRWFLFREGGLRIGEIQKRGYGDVQNCITLFVNGPLSASAPLASYLFPLPLSCGRKHRWEHIPKGLVKKIAVYGFIYLAFSKEIKVQLEIISSKFSITLLHNSKD